MAAERAVDHQAMEDSSTQMARTILITGGAGTLGSVIAPMLAAAGWSVRRGDVRPTADGIGEFVSLDLRRPEDARRAVEGAEAIIHAAAWHGMHLRDHPPRDFWELNVDGTYNLLEAASDAGVARIVVSSTMGVYGSSARPDDDDPAIRVHEALPLRPGDIYGHSKVIAERLGAFFERTRGVRAIALRYGMFVPEPFAHYGIRLLYGGVDARDVAWANIAALGRMEQPGEFAAYNVFSALPFDDSDLDRLRTDPMAAVARRWPDAPAQLAAVGAKLWGPINVVYDSSRAARELGWTPRFGFAEFMDGIRRGVSSEADLEPAGAGAIVASADA
jgi:UDP-glucose 4-epimerase